MDNQTQINEDLNNQFKFYTSMHYYKRDFCPIIEGKYNV